MKTLTALFFSTKYWRSREEIAAAAETISKTFPQDKVVTVVDGYLTETGDYDTLIVVPCSGSVQPDIVRLCQRFRQIILFAAYVPGNYDLELTDKMLCKNAAPTLMDVYGVLKREETKTVTVKKNIWELEQYRRILHARDQVKHGKITVIKGPEPWVISVSRQYEVYTEHLGVAIETVTQDELMELYQKTTAAQARDIYEYYQNDASEVIEPTEEDLWKCARLAKAMVKLMEDHHSDGMAIACFDLIGKIGVNPCLGVSYINGETDKFAACEGDIDSAVTMLMLHSLTKEKLWMANPCLQTDDSINFAHCTAPLRVNGRKQKFLLRNHHESGIGASPRVFYDTGLSMSICRYSGVLHQMTIHRGTSVLGRYEPNCRTQMRIHMEDFQHYMDTNLGCHQVMTFTDITEDIRELCALLQIKIL